MQIHNLSENDVEKITYETAMLVAAGWRRVHIVETEDYKILSDQYKFDDLDYVWLWLKPPPFSKNKKNSVLLNRLRHYDLYDRIDVSFFDRTEAFELLMENANGSR